MGGCASALGDQWWRSVDRALMTKEEAKRKMLGDPALLKTHKGVNLSSDSSWATCGWGMMATVFADPDNVKKIGMVNDGQVKQLEMTQGKKPEKIDWEKYVDYDQLQANKGPPKHKINDVSLNGVGSHSTNLKKLNKKTFENSI